MVYTRAHLQTKFTFPGGTRNEWCPSRILIAPGLLTRDVVKLPEVLKEGDARLDYLRLKCAASPMRHFTLLPTLIYSAC